MNVAFSDVMLVVIAVLLFVCALYLEKIRDHVETIRNIQWKKFFGD